MTKRSLPAVLQHEWILANPHPDEAGGRRGCKAVKVRGNAGCGLSVVEFLALDRLISQR